MTSPITPLIFSKFCASDNEVHSLLKLYFCFHIHHQLKFGYISAILVSNYSLYCACKHPIIPELFLPNL